MKITFNNINEFVSQIKEHDINIDDMNVRKGDHTTILEGKNIRIVIYPKRKEAIICLTADKYSSTKPISPSWMKGDIRSLANLKRSHEGPPPPVTVGFSYPY